MNFFFLGGGAQVRVTLTLNSVQAAKKLFLYTLHKEKTLTILVLPLMAIYYPSVFQLKTSVSSSTYMATTVL